jgi:23S rRNA pseudouridine2605 synthase
MGSQRKTAKKKAGVQEAVRVQKLLAQAGIASRRKAEEYIAAGRVTVNGEVVRLGARALPEEDDLRLDGEPVQLEQNKVYLLLNKPRGYITSVSDDRGRPVVLDLLSGVTERVYPVGRLDFETEGILLLTNDGELAHVLIHPSHQVPRTYQAKVRGFPSPETLRQLMAGVELEDGPAHALHVERFSSTKKHTWIDVTLTEGRNRQVRRMCQAIGHPVLRLRRTRFAYLTVDNLRPGQYRPLTRNEVKELRSLVG